MQVSFHLADVPRESTLLDVVCKLGYMSTLATRATEARLEAAKRNPAFLVVAQFATAIGVKPSAIYQIEDTTTKSLKAETLAAYERVTGFRADWIRTGKGEKKVGSGVVVPLRVAERAADYVVSQAVKLDVLTMAIQEVEAVLEDAGLDLVVSKRAAVIASTYALLEQGLPSATVVQFIRAAVA